MAMMVCDRCGSDEFVERDGVMVCAFCRAKAVPASRPEEVAESEISVADDVRRLLEKCESNPAKARKYASLVLDIDPTNKEALKYLR